jgi:glycosyltransferase involved in cell wall biosynthesis
MMLVYNTEKYVGEAIRSILDQTIEDFELIIINDGSTDRSLQVAREYAASDRRIRLVSRENRGIIASRNEALALATGEYLAIMDSDDIALPERLEKQARYLDEHPECTLVCCQMQVIDPAGAPIRVINLESTHEEIDAINMGGSGYFVPVSMMVRHDALVAIGGFSEKFALAEDRHICLRLAERGRLASIPEVLYRYRQHTQSVCRLRPELLATCVNQIVDEARQRRGLAPLASAGQATMVGAGKSLTVTETHRAWAWWALAAGNIGTARKHAALCVIQKPFSLETWRLFFCALRGW